MKKMYKIQNFKVKAAWQVDFSNAPNDFEYMPAGEHTICCSVNGKPKEVTINVDENTALLLQHSLDEVFSLFDKGEMSKPFIDFDHSEGEAAAFPKRFFWQDGVRLEVEWTEAGRRAVETQNYNYCSPSFLFDESGEVKGVAFPGAIGALVNVPAFQKIQKITAKLTTQKKENDMSKQNKEPTQEELLKQKDDEITALKAQLEEVKNAQPVEPKKDDELEQLKAELEQLKKEKQQAEDEAQASRKKFIEDSVEALVKAGRVKPEGKQAILNAALASSDNGKAIFDALPDAVVDNPVVKAKKQETELSGLDRAAAAFNKQLKK